MSLLVVLPANLSGLMWAIMFMGPFPAHFTTAYSTHTPTNCKISLILSWECLHLGKNCTQSLKNPLLVLHQSALICHLCLPLCTQDKYVVMVLWFCRSVERHTDFDISVKKKGFTMVNLFQNKCVDYGIRSFSINFSVYFRAKRTVEYIKKIYT